jgi:glyoxylase-like metal-dependent hydrolase (beta-lactamase superfamily II)
MTGGAWSAAGCFEVSPGVHRIPLTMPQDGLRAVNVYALETPDGLALVDGGWHVPGTYSELSDALRLIGRTVDQVHDVYVTHVHRDHYTFAVELRRRHGARVHLGALEEPGLRAVTALGSNVPTSSLQQLHRADEDDLAAEVRATTTRERFDSTDWELPDAWLRPGPLTVGDRRLDVVATPGHTKGHVVLHDLAAGLVFTGDHVLPTITPSIGFELGAWDLPLQHYLDSLTTLLDRPDGRQLPAHGWPTSSVHDRVRALLDHHAHRLSTMRHAVERLGAATGGSVAAAVTWTQHERPYDELDAFNQMIAVCETLAHLDVLVTQGRLRVTSHDARDVFRV